MSGPVDHAKAAAAAEVWKLTERCPESMVREALSNLARAYLDLTAQNARLERATVALARYGTHESDCAIRYRFVDMKGCTCGLDADLKGEP